MKRYTTPRPRRSGDSWSVIYIDLMTNMMVFFVLLWAINTREPKGIDDAVGDQIVKMVTLPGDVLFPPGKEILSEQGRSVVGKLFADETGTVLRFEQSALTRRQLVIHGHTDGDGDKEENLELGYRRALSAYHEIKTYGAELADNVVICTHADNTPAVPVPAFSGAVSAAEKAALREAKAKNRRITIEDKLSSVSVQDGP